MKTIIFLDEQLNVLERIENVESVTPSLSNIVYTSTEGSGELRGVKTLFFVLDEDIPLETITRADVYDYMKQLKIEEVKEENEQNILLGYEHNGDWFSYDYKNQGNFTSTLSLMLVDSTIVSLMEKTENNGVKTYSREEYIGIVKAGEDHKRTKMRQYYETKKRIEETEFVDFIDLISTNIITEGVSGISETFLL